MREFENINTPEAKKDQAWESQQDMMEAIYTGGFEGFFNKIPERGRAFDSQKKLVCCMDEGVTHVESESKLSLAGSGILYPAGSWEERLERVAELLHSLGVEEVTSHDGCGAAKLAWERDGGNKKLGHLTPDEYGRKWSLELQALLNTKTNLHDIAHRHISHGEMKRPPEFHNARMVYFDGTGTFNPDKLNDKIPNGFVIDYRNETRLAKNRQEMDYPFEELKVALEIAFGNHGFGKKFTPENPLVISVITKGDKDDKLMEKIEKLIPSDLTHKVKIDSLTIDKKYKSQRQV
jgi:hypothetical protein